MCVYVCVHECVCVMSVFVCVCVIVHAHMCLWVHVEPEVDADCLPLLLFDFFETGAVPEPRAHCLVNVWTGWSDNSEDLTVVGAQH